MFQTLRNAWKIEDLRKKLLFTLLILVIVRLGCAIPVPFLDPSRLQEMLDSTLYLVMRDNLTGKLVADASPCNMCRRMIINAGIREVIVRNDETHFTVFDVEKDFVQADDTLPEEQLNTYGL